MFADKEALVHFVGGAVGGTVATAITCPLEVVKTRMQSSKGINVSGDGPSTSQGAGPTSRASAPPGPSHTANNLSSSYKKILGNAFPTHIAIRGSEPNQVSVSLLRFLQTQATQNRETRRKPTIFRYFSHIVKTEGINALYKGLGPNLLGVAPSKAVYFCTYSSSKRFWNENDVFVPNSAAVHMVSSASAGFVAATVINPIWLVKTRLQLSEHNSSVGQTIRRVYNREGIRGFYKGVTASYAGVSETVIQFVLYEYLRSMVMEYSKDENDKSTVDFVNFMVAGGMAKFVSCIVAYPHEVVRTRLREESNEKRGFFRTLYQLYKEGYRSMYRGLSVQLLRTVPNTAITMSTYELVVYSLHQL